MMQGIITNFIFLILITTIGWASIIQIPQDYQTIQEGIENANDGDTLLVAPGDYEESIDFLGKAITVASNFILDNEDDFVASTSILGTSWPGTVCFISGEIDSSRLIGFTVTTAITTNYLFPGIYCSYSSPSIMHCVISDNHGVDGGGIRLSNSNSVLKHLSIVNNHAEDEDEVMDGSGGGIFMWNSNPVVENLYIAQNFSLWGSAIFVMGSSNALFKRCIIDGNTSEWGSIIGCGLWAELSFINSTIVNNVSEYLFAASVDWTISVANSIIFYNATPLLVLNEKPMLINYSNLQFEYEDDGNLQEPPLFVDISNENFNLQETSPCIDAGINDTTLLFNGGLDSLIVPNTRYYGSGVDMGAFEYIPIEGIFGDLNQDSIIDILDIIGLVQIILGFEEQTDYHLYYGDMDNDHVLGILDIVAIVDVILYGEG